MPCSDGVPDKRDMRASSLLELIVKLKQSGADIEPPKSWDGKFRAYDCDMGDYLDEATRILCTFCRTVGDDYIYNGRFKERRQLADWWDEHKEIDKREGRM